MSELEKGLIRSLTPHDVAHELKRQDNKPIKSYCEGNRAQCEGEWSANNRIPYRGWNSERASEAHFLLLASPLPQEQASARRADMLANPLRIGGNGFGAGRLLNLSLYFRLVMIQNGWRAYHNSFKILGSGEEDLAQRP